MKKKLIVLSLLAVASAAVIASCDTPTGGDSSSNTPTTSSTDAGGDSGTSENTDVWATRVKITQPGTLIVGATFKVSECVTFTPETANKWTVVSTNTEVATVGADNDTVTIVGAGTCGVQIKGQTNNVLGQINITAMTEAGKALKEFVEGLSNDLCIDGTWNSISGVWANAGEDVTFASSEDIGMLVTPKYVVDNVYGQYSAVSLEKDDGAAYSYTLLTASDATVSFANGMKAGLSDAAKVEIGDKVSSAYIDSYFVQDGTLLDVADYTEGEDGWFTLNDGTTAQNLIGNLFSMTTSSYTGVSAKVKLTNGVLEGQIRFDYKSTTGQELDFTIETGVKCAALETAVTEAEPPAPLDVSGLASHYAAFGTNYVMSWEVGVFDTSYKPVSGFYSYNTVGVSYYTADSWIYAYGTRDADTGAITLDSGTVRGYYADSTGIYSVSLDEDGTIVKAETAASTAHTSVYDVIYSVADMTEAVLSAADLTVGYEGSSYTQYNYDATFDTMAVFSIAEGMSPMSYKLSSDTSNAQYCEGYIFDAGTTIQQYFAERVNLTSTTSGREGYKQVISNAGAAPTDTIGKKAWEAFPSLFSDPSTVTDSGSGETGGEAA